MLYQFESLLLSLLLFITVVVLQTVTETGETGDRGGPAPRHAGRDHRAGTGAVITPPRREMVQTVPATAHRPSRVIRMSVLVRI